jgi:integrase
MLDTRKPVRRTTNNLTDSTIRKTRRTDRTQRLLDGGGLALVLPPAGAPGSPWWRFDYRFAGKARTISFGTYPVVTLATAREKRLAAKREIDAGTDPSASRRRDKRRAVIVHAATFEAVAREWLAGQRKVVAPSTMTRNGGLLLRAAYPAIGRLPIASLEPPDVLAMLRPIEGRGHHESAHRLKSLVSQVCRYGVANGYAVRDPTADLRGALAPVPTEHYAAVTSATAIGELLRAIDALIAAPGVVAAMRLAPLVFVRPGELRRATWTEINLEDALWRIPSDRVKTRSVHLVPLARQALEILGPLKAAAARAEKGYVFPAARTPKRPISDMTLTAALRRMGYGPDQMSAHGFRAMARTALDEQLRVRGELIELQLNHRTPGTLAATYNRALYLEDRRAMMQTWADYLDELRARSPR